MLESNKALLFIKASTLGSGGISDGIGDGLSVVLALACVGNTGSGSDNSGVSGGAVWLLIKFVCKMEVLLRW